MNYKSELKSKRSSESTLQRTIFEWTLIIDEK